MSGVVRWLIGTRLTLPAALGARFPELETVQWRRGGLPLRVAGAFLGLRTVAAITLWNVVFVASENVLSAELALHELGHVRQFAASWSFPLRYLFEAVRRGYANSRYEHEAQAFAIERLRADPNLLSRR